MPLVLAERAAPASPIALVTAAEARVLRLAVSSAAFHRVRPGVYARRGEWDGLPPWQRYAVRVHAFALLHPDAALCLESAAVVLGLPLFGEAPDIHVFDPERAASRRFGDVCVHTSADPRLLVRVNRILVTALIDTVADLARVLPPAYALCVADAAISPTQGGPLTVSDLRDHTAAQVNARGRAQLSWVWSNADAGSESPGESVSRAVMGWVGFESPEVQRRFFYEGISDRTDFFFPRTGCVGESDGWGKYDLADAAAAQRHLREEKRREDRLRRHGHPFARWELADAMRVTPMSRALDLAGVRRVAQPDRAGLASLRRSPRVR